MPASSHPKDSPDARTTYFQARDETNGVVTMGSDFKLGVKWPTVYKVTVYDYMDQVAHVQNLNPPLPESHPVALSGTIHGQTFSHSQAGPVNLYIGIAANDTLRSASRNAIGAVTRYSNNPDGSPYYCGPAYGNACYKYVGTPGYVTLQRLNATVDFTADSTAAWFGSPVSFLLSAAHVEGQLMTIAVDSTSWIPDADSLGGDWNEAAKINACTWSGYANYKTCTKNIRGSGKLRVVGGINGKYFEKEWHIARRDPYPILTAKKYFVNANQVDTFTVRMSDNSAFTVWKWTWAPDSGAVQNLTSCGQSNPCVKSITESGHIRAQVYHNWVHKYTKAHVTVGPRPALQVVADHDPVIVGDSVKYTAGANGAPVTISSWKFGAQAIPSCAGARVCWYWPTQDGVVKVYGQVDGVSDSASVLTTVAIDTEIAPEEEGGCTNLRNSSSRANLVSTTCEEAQASLVCSPNEVVRLSRVLCTIQASPGAFVVSGLISKTDGDTTIFSVSQSIAVAADSVLRIGGTAARWTVLSANVLVDGVTIPVADTFAILSRIGRDTGWVAYQAPTTLPGMFVSGPPYLNASYPGIVANPLGTGDYAIAEGAVGKTSLPYPLPKVGPIRGGPNGGIWVTTAFRFGSPDAIPVGHYISQALDPADPFYQRQTGGSPQYCSQAHMASLRTLIENHEKQHWNTFRDTTASFNAQQRFEQTALVLGNVTSDTAIAKFFTIIKSFDSLAVRAHLAVDQVILPVQPNAPICDMRP
ncbi:MAG TPA: hypothetical protein VEB19_06450 [Gemmatimonadaceae bacterium]|nr:hypothetical protein [Gemmatimonadaceae bacterium]